MKCPNCGKLISDNQSYCTNCGIKLKGKGGNVGHKTSLHLIFVYLFSLVIVFTLLFFNPLKGKLSQSSQSSKTEDGLVASEGNSDIASEPASENGVDPAPEPREGAVNGVSGTGEEPGTEPAIGSAGSEPVREELESEPIEPKTQYTIPSSAPDEYYVHNGHTYAFYNANRYGFNTYRKVAQFCRDQGGHLAVINDSEENKYLFELVRDYSPVTAFFGYSDENSEGDWQWADGYSDFENWTTYGDWDLPDNGSGYGGDEDYAEFNYDAKKDWVPNDGTWNDAPFRDNTDTFICEWDFDVPKKMQ